jgi:hypothetical protein
MPEKKPTTSRVSREYLALGRLNTAQQRLRKPGCAEEALSCCVTLNPLKERRPLRAAFVSNAG